MIQKGVPAIKVFTSLPGAIKNDVLNVATLRYSSHNFREIETESQLIQLI